MKVSFKQYAQSLYAVVREAESDGDIKAAVENFVKIIAARRDLGKTMRIIAEFEKIWNEERGITEGELISARELDKEIVALLHNYIVKLLSVKKEVKLENKIDKSILGGFVAKVGDTVVDGSVKRQLESLKNELAS
ncbi:ATP synthase F1 subunit delta [Candidatus Falkowbacteria bacterium CG10_big_fil_rev_8_21_14_0_10_44_15]|uniref:ATP synthase subunit delta n=1 Tax=Candidatus Falkowbacteria bacterium CG10_big_fil_rev_8_21_14_0_10_44_15 TaxID=1974569 RepID=A0A2H0UZ01_9BACT|nr:MAG: ATP synthase F1 subunit delta [Candidatus Falkowbacteria bacterium CG10_big_fil_rev_8_21_14_0_10_44_15]